MLEPHGTAPYAPSSAVIAAITEKRRDPSLTRIDSDQLEQLGIRGSLVPRTLQTLRLLDLVDDDGVITPLFEELVSSPSMSRGLQKVLRRAYAPVFEVIDPTTADGDELEAAFEQFGPAGQRPRMVTLFTNLMKAAKLIPIEAQTAGVAKSVQSPRSAVAGKLVGPASSAAPRNPASRWAQAAAAQPTARHTLELASGGTINVTLDVNLFTLSPADREFVMGLVDRVTSYRDTKTNRKAQN